MFPLFRSHYLKPHVPLRVSSTQIASQAVDPACDRFFFCVFGDVAVWRDLSAANDDLTQCSGLLPARVSSVLKCAIAKLSKSSGGMPCVESLEKCVYLAGTPVFSPLLFRGPSLCLHAFPLSSLGA